MLIYQCRQCDAGWSLEDTCRWTHQWCSHIRTDSYAVWWNTHPDLEKHKEMHRKSSGAPNTKQEVKTTRKQIFKHHEAGSDQCMCYCMGAALYYESNSSPSTVTDLQMNCNWTRHRKHGLGCVCVWGGGKTMVNNTERGPRWTQCAHLFAITNKPDKQRYWQMRCVPGPERRVHVYGPTRAQEHTSSNGASWDSEQNTGGGPSPLSTTTWKLSQARTST